MSITLKKITTYLQFMAYGAYIKGFSKKLVRHNGTNFYLGTKTANEAHRGFTFSTKEPETLLWIDQFAGENPVFYDVGANIGIYSLYASKRWPLARIFAFEPDAQSFAALCRNSYYNRPSSTRLNIIPFPFAISSGSAVAELNLSSMSAGAGAAALGHDYEFLHIKPNDIFHQGTAAFSLDDLVGLHSLPQPNYLKIDVDGLETTILHGAKKVLSSPELRGLLVEFQYKDEADLKPIMQELLEYGFRINAMSAWISGYKDTLSRNFIFLKSDSASPEA